jgi:hypothetical protein
MSQSADDTNRSRLQSLLEANAPIPAKLVEELMASDDRADQADAFYCLSERWGQIRPEREVWATAPFVLGFLIGTITDPPERAHTDSNALSHYEAAHTLVTILRNLSDHPEGSEPRRELVERITQTFLAGNESVRDCIETGFLEHALEHPDLRPLFERWENDPEMREAHARALAWGCSHERR